MPRKKSYTDAQADQVKALALKGLTSTSIEFKLGIPKRTVQRILLDSSVSSVPVPPAPAPAPKPEAPKETHEVLEPLRALIPSVSEWIQRAMDDDDPRSANVALRILSQISTLLARFEPPPPEDPNELPDMIEAARDCKEKLEAYLRKK